MAPVAEARSPSASMLEAEIALRAYEKWFARGQPQGTQLPDWLEAEAEVRHRLEIARQLTEVEKRLIAEHAVCRALALSDSLYDAAPKILQAVCESSGWDVGEVWVVDQNAKVLRCVDLWHTPGINVSAFVRDTRQRTFPAGMGLPGRIWEIQSPAWIPDVIADINLPQAATAAKSGLHGAVGFPIHRGKEFLGVIEFFSREVREPDEDLLDMMASIGSQVGQFIERTQAKEELLRQEEERRIARQIQQGLLPKTMPTLPGFRIAAKLATAKDVGGDYFDFIPYRVHSREHLLVLVADASGHGVAAALMMAETRAYVRALASACADIDTLLAVTNSHLARDLVDGNFVTLLLAQIDPDCRSLQYANAGHCSGYVLDRRGQVKAVLESTGLPLGIAATGEYPVGPAVALASGDLIFLFTDGFVEASSPSGELFGMERTFEILKGHQQQKQPEEILRALFESVEQFSDHQLRDDVTALIIAVGDSEPSAG